MDVVFTRDKLCETESELAVTEPWIDAEWIRDRLRATGKTQRGLAKALELDPSAVSRLLEGTRQLKAQEIPHIMEFFQAPPTKSEMVGRAEKETRKLSATTEGFGGPAPEQLERHRTPPGPRPKARPSPDLPVLGPLAIDRHGFYVLGGDVAERRPCPPQLVGVPGAYALFVPDNRLAPRYRAGEVIYVHPSRPPTVGSFVTVRFRPPDGRVVIGEVTLADPRSLTLRTEGWDGKRERELTLKMEEVGQIGRIVVTATE
jgi:transcriptional regulator with XRE-family HTH domain